MAERVVDGCWDCAPELVRLRAELDQKTQVLGLMQWRYNNLAQWVRERGGDVDEISTRIQIGERVGVD